MNWFSWLKAIVPVILMLNSKTQAIAGPVSDAIGAAELLGGSGADKKAQVMQIAADAITAANTVAGKETVPVTDTLAATSSAVDTVVSVVNALAKT